VAAENVVVRDTWILAIEGCFLGRLAVTSPLRAPDALSFDLQVLTAQFFALVTLFARVPVPSDTDARRAAVEMVVILRPSVEAAEATLRHITAAFVSHLGGISREVLGGQAPGPLTLCRLRPRRPAEGDCTTGGSDA
jgi:hypothetical protein